MRACFFATVGIQRGGAGDAAQPLNPNLPFEQVLLLGHQDFLAAHVGLEAFGDGDGAVFLEVVFQERDEHARGCNAGVVERVGQIHLAVRTLDADAETAGLCVAGWSSASAVTP